MGRARVQAAAGWVPCVCGHGGTPSPAAPMRTQYGSVGLAARRRLPWLPVTMAVVSTVAGAVLRLLSACYSPHAYTQCVALRFVHARVTITIIDVVYFVGMSMGTVPPALHSPWPGNVDRKVRGREMPESPWPGKSVARKVRGQERPYDGTAGIPAVPRRTLVVRRSSSRGCAERTWTPLPPPWSCKFIETMGRVCVLVHRRVS